VKEALVAPAVTVTEDGTAPAALLLLSVTTAPPAGAGPLRVTVPDEGVPPVTAAGFRATVDGAGGVTVRSADCVTPPRLAVMLTGVAAATAIVVTAKTPVVLPPGTVTDAGTAATAALPLASVTTMPPVGAALDKVTVPEELTLPSTVAGLRATEFSPGGVTVKDAVTLIPEYEAVIVTAVWDATGIVVTVKAAVELPAGTVTAEGTVAAALLLLSDTLVPPAGAGPARVTVPEEDVPPVTDPGLTATEPIATGVTVKSAVLVLVPYIAVIVTVAGAATGSAETENVAVVEPPATVTDAGTVAAAVLLLLNDTDAPAAGAGAESVTVPVELDPPLADVGLSVNRESPAGVTVRSAVRVTLSKVAPIVSVVEEATASVDTLKVAVVEPAPTVTVPGTVAAAVLLLDSDTAIPPAGAAPVNVTVPVELTVPVTEAGLRLTALRAGGVTVSSAVWVEPP
jgi:hypothetical protein